MFLKIIFDIRKVADASLKNEVKQAFCLVLFFDGRS